VNIRDRRNTSGTLAWALSLAALVFIAGAASVALEAYPDRLVGALVVVALCAAACGIALDRRLHRAQSQALRDPLTGLPNRVLLEIGSSRPFSALAGRTSRSRSSRSTSTVSRT
jgi:GGDEF domain-containing protein